VEESDKKAKPGRGSKKGAIRPHMTSKKVQDPEEEERLKRRQQEENFKYLKAVKDSKILWLLLIAVVLLYLVFKAPLLGAMAALLIIIIVGLEIWVGIKTGGLMHEVQETAIAVILALIIWYGAGFLLNTDTPLDAVVSCSMQPALDRGHMMVLQGTGLNSPEAYLTKEEWRIIKAGGLLTRQCAVCRSPSYDQACLVDGLTIVEHDELFSYECAICERTNSSGKIWRVPCTTGVMVKNKTFKNSELRDVIVYTPEPGDPFASSGDIVHRAQVVIDVEGEKYVLAKGDNNNLFDVQIGNSPVDMERVKGKAIFAVPYLGYFKLFLSGLFSEPAGCGERFTGTQAIKMDR